MASFNLSTFPDVCRLCLQSKHPDELVPLETDRPLYGGKLSDLLEELTFKIPTKVSNYFPSEVCSMCLEVFDFFYKYKQKMNYIHRFLVAFVEVKLGDDRPLVKLFNDHNDYFSILLKDLDICNKDELLVEDMLEEYPQYMIASMPDTVKTETGVEEDQSEVEQVDEYEIQVEILDEKENDKDNFLVEKLLEELGEVTDSSTGEKLVEIKAEPVNLLPVILEGSQLGVEEVPYTESEHLEDFSEDYQEDALEIDTNDEEEVGSLSVDKEDVPKIAKKEEKTKICYNCSKCKFKTNYKEAFAAHQRLHEQYDGLEGVQCTHSSCLKVFPSQEEYQKHLKEGLHNQHVCDICGASLKHKFSLEVHLARHSGSPQFQCQYCSSAFFTKTEMRNHIMSIHTTGAKCECSKCGAIFKNNKLLKQHLESHAEQRNFKCKSCDFAFKTQQHLKRHIATVHKEVRFNCDHCEMSYGRKDKLRMHMERAHSIQTYFVCDICLRSFNNRSGLQEHLGHHANPKPLQCSVCLIAYDNDRTFKGHLCITYRDDYVCCEKDFKFHAIYNRHMLMEHGIKSNARVKHKSGQLMGQLRAGRKQPIRCRTCKQTFQTAAERKKHAVGCGKAEMIYSVEVLPGDNEATSDGQSMQIGEMGEEEHLEDDDGEDHEEHGYVISEIVEEDVTMES